MVLTAMHRYAALVFSLGGILAVSLGGCGGSAQPCRCSSNTDSSKQYSSAVLPSNSGLLGDMNDNGLADVGDAIKILRIVVNLDPDHYCADANQNGSTEVGDAIKVLRCVVGSEPWPIGQCGVQIMGNITDLFSGAGIDNASVDINGNIVYTSPDGSYSMTIPPNANAPVSISANSYYDSNTSVDASLSRSPVTLDRGIIPVDATFLQFFDEVCRGRASTGYAIDRWLTQPQKWYINASNAKGSNKPIEQWQIDLVKDIIKYQNQGLGLPTFSNGFISSPVIEEGISPPAWGTPGYVRVEWDDTIPGAGGHGEYLNGNEIYAAYGKIRTNQPRKIYIEELTQVLGARMDSEIYPDSIFSDTDNGFYSQEDLNLGLWLYSRPPGSTSPDNDPSGPHY